MVSFLHTTGMDITPDVESVSYHNDNLYINILLLIFSMALCYVVMPLLKNIPLWAEIAFIAVWTIIIGLLWVYSSQSAPTEDSWRVTNASLCFAKDDFSPLDERYFKDYSFQLGYVFFNEVLIRIASIFGEVTDLLFLEALNVIFLAVTFEDNNFDASEASKDSVANIEERLGYFMSNPQYTNDFFYEKTVS